MNDNLKLKQSNNLILATHRMSTNQMRIFFYVCSQYQGNLKLQLSFSEMNNILNTERGTKQKDLLLSNISSLMRNAFIDLKIDEEDEYFEAPVFIMARKKKNEDIMHFEFNPHVAKELEELKGYTWMYLSQLTGMSSQYSIRLYEFLAMRLGTMNIKETFEFDITKLRLYLDCVNKYSQFEAFDRRVLQQAKKEINEKTNIRMSYRKIKTGRSITSIKFIFSWKNKTDIIDPQSMDHRKPIEQTRQLELDDFLKQFE